MLAFEAEYHKYYYKESSEYLYACFPNCPLKSIQNGACDSLQRTFVPSISFYYNSYNQYLNSFSNFNYKYV